MSAFQKFYLMSDSQLKGNKMKQSGGRVDIDADLKKQQLDRVQADMAKVLSRPARRKAINTRKKRRSKLKKPKLVDRTGIAADEQYAQYKYLYEQMQRILSWFRDRQGDAAQSRTQTPPPPPLTHSSAEEAVKREQHRRARRSPTAQVTTVETARETPTTTTPIRKRRKRRSYSELVRQGHLRNLRSKKVGTALPVWQTLDGSPVVMEDDDDDEIKEMKEWARERRNSNPFSPITRKD